MIVSKLFKKTLLIMILLFAIIAVTTMISASWSLRENLTEEFKSKGKAIALSIAETSAETILNRDASTVQAMTDRFIETLGVSYIYVVDSQGTIISHTFVPGIPGVLMQKKRKHPFEETVPIRIPEMGDFIDISAPIVEGHIGHVHVGMNISLIESQVMTAMMRQLYPLLIIFAVSVAIAYFLIRRFSQPLTELTEYAKRLAAHDFSATVEINSKDEIGLLTDIMKSMASDLQDVFERYELALKDAIVELQDTLAYLTVVIDTMADGLIVTDTEGVINHINPAASLMFGLSQNAMLGLHCSNLIGNAFAELLHIPETEREKVFTSEVSLVRNRTGKAVASKIHSDILPSEHQEGGGSIGAVILIRDITAEKEVDRMKTDFISTVSHELRTPLTTMRGLTEIIEKRLRDDIFTMLPSVDEKADRIIRRVLENLSIILSEGERLTRLIDDLLTIANLESGNVTWKMESLSIEEVIDQAIRVTSPLFQMKNLELHKKIEDGIPCIIGDRDRLVQVIVNLLSNAVKFTDTGYVACTAGRQADVIVVRIIDTGTGIPGTEKNRIFERFKQVGDTLTDKPKGMGLGLPICRQIIEYHGGEIRVESEFGFGSCFSFSLPIVESLR